MIYVTIIILLLVAFLIRKLSIEEKPAPKKPITKKLRDTHIIEYTGNRPIISYDKPILNQYASVVENLKKIHETPQLQQTLKAQKQASGPTMGTFYISPDEMEFYRRRREAESNQAFIAQEHMSNEFFDTCNSEASYDSHSSSDSDSSYD